MPTTDETLKRFGTEPESAERLAAHAITAEAVLRIHGVSVTHGDCSSRAGKPGRR